AVRNAVALAGHPGLDVRADDGYSVARPSIRSSGRVYRWEAAPGEIALQPFPAWVAALSNKSAHCADLDPGSVSGNGHKPGGLEQGQRNHALTSKGGAMRHAGLDREDIEAALLVLNAKFCNPPLPEAEVRGIAKSIARYERGVLGPLAEVNLEPLDLTQATVDLHAPIEFGTTAGEVPPAYGRTSSLRAGILQPGRPSMLCLLSEADRIPRPRPHRDRSSPRSARARP